MPLVRMIRMMRLSPMIQLMMGRREMGLTIQGILIGFRTETIPAPPNKRIPPSSVLDGH